MLDKLKDKVRGIDKKYLLINLVIVVIGMLVIGYVVRLVISNFGSFIGDEPFRWNLMFLLQPGTWFTGAIVILVLWAVFLAGRWSHARPV